jgi:exosome complex component RRP46
MTLTATLIAVTSDEFLVRDPSAKQIEAATSLHVLSFSSHGDLLVVESEGKFSIDVWDNVYEEAKRICQGSDFENGTRDVDMDSEEQQSLEDILRRTVHEKVVKDQSWKENLA